MPADFKSRLRIRTRPVGTPNRGVLAGRRTGIGDELATEIAWLLASLWASHARKSAARSSRNGTEFPWRFFFIGGVESDARTRPIRLKLTHREARQHPLRRPVSTSVL